jgi:hypothetical protein|tara:strand:+ start:304 stop:516 length:213 start_codon:yes stop_codon:yes gene_type:complete
MQQRQELNVRELERENNMLSSQNESPKKPNNTEEQLEFDFDELRKEKEKKRKEEFNLPENPLDDLLKRIK